MKRREVVFEIGAWAQSWEWAYTPVLYSIIPAQDFGAEKGAGLYPEAGLYPGIYEIFTEKNHTHKETCKCPQVYFRKSVCALESRILRVCPEKEVTSNCRCDYLMYQKDQVKKFQHLPLTRLANSEQNRWCESPTGKDDKAQGDMLRATFTGQECKSCHDDASNSKPKININWLVFIGLQHKHEYQTSILTNLGWQFHLENEWAGTRHKD